MMIPRIPDRYINQRNFKIAVSLAAIALISGFFVSELKFLRPPALEISEPSQDIETGSAAFDVRGRTDPDADLTMNSRPLFSAGNGEFTERVYLVKGVNELAFVARNRYGKTTALTRYIVVK